MSATPQIRPATEADLPRITAIYSHHVLHGTGTFETEPPTLDQMRQRLQEVYSRDLPWLVAELNGQVAGFAYCNWFRPRAAFRYSAEDSIYLAPEAGGQGLGTLLLGELIRRAEALGIRKLIAVIGDSHNQASRGLHRRHGFIEAGIIRNCGWKHGRWLDIVMVERVLGAGAETLPE